MNFVGLKVIEHNLWFINCLLTLRVWLAGKSWEVVKRCKTPSNGPDPEDVVYHLFEKGQGGKPCECLFVLLLLARIIIWAEDLPMNEPGRSGPSSLVTKVAKVQEIILLHHYNLDTSTQHTNKYQKLLLQKKRNLHKPHFIISWGKTMPESSTGGDVIQIRYTVA